MADHSFFRPHPTVLAMIEDLRAIADVSREVVEELATQLEQREGFFDAESLHNAISQVVGDPRQATAVYNALRNLDASSVERVLELVTTWRESDGENADAFPTAAAENLEQNLPTLLGDFPALKRMKKAERLQNILSNEFEGVAFICDLRPVFNESRDHVEGLLPVTTMKLQYEDQSGETLVVEIALDRQQLHELCEKAGQAQQKLNVLCQTFADLIPGALCRREEG